MEEQLFMIIFIIIYESIYKLRVVSVNLINYLLIRMNVLTDELLVKFDHFCQIQELTRNHSPAFQ